MNGWTPGTVPSMQGEVVLGWHPEWVDPDFNPKGIRECFYVGEDNDPEWLSAEWNGHHDRWDNSDEAPLYWREQPDPPILPFIADDDSG